jgi:hypothetical protein
MVRRRITDIAHALLFIACIPLGLGCALAEPVVALAIIRFLSASVLQWLDPIPSGSQRTLQGLVRFFSKPDPCDDKPVMRWPLSNNLTNTRIPANALARTGSSRGLKEKSAEEYIKLFNNDSPRSIDPIQPNSVCFQDFARIIERNKDRSRVMPFAASIWQTSSSFTTNKRFFSPNVSVLLLHQDGRTTQIATDQFRGMSLRVVQNPAQVLSHINACSGRTVFILGHNNAGYYIFPGERVPHCDMHIGRLDAIGQRSHVTLVHISCDSAKHASYGLRGGLRSIAAISRVNAAVRRSTSTLDLIERLELQVARCGDVARLRNHFEREISITSRLGKAIKLLGPAVTIYDAYRIHQEEKHRWKKDSHVPERRYDTSHVYFHPYTQMVGDETVTERTNAVEKQKTAKKLSKNCAPIGRTFTLSRVLQPRNEDHGTRWCNQSNIHHRPAAVHMPIADLSAQSLRKGQRNRHVELRQVAKGMHSGSAEQRLVLDVSRVQNGILTRFRIPGNA